MNYKRDWDYTEGDGPGVWWSRNAPRTQHDEYLDGDADGMGAFRGAFHGFIVTVALFGVLFIVAELHDILSVNAKVGLAGLFFASLAGWRAWHLFQNWKDWKGYLTVIVPGVLTFAWSLAVWGW